VVIEVSAFDILVRVPEESDESAEEDDVFERSKQLCWEIFVGIKFKSSKPKDWGEFRAYGGSCVWKGKVADGTQLVDPAHIKNHPGLLHANCRKLLPKWAHADRPTKVNGQAIENGDDLRIANDQHVLIFYKQPVANVPRSGYEGAHSKQKQRYEDAELSDELAEGTNVLERELWMYNPLVDPQPVDDPNQEDNDIIPAWTKKYDVVMSDEPSGGAVLGGEQVRYWHQAEYRIMKPKSHEIVWSHRLWLKLEGNMAGLKREALLDDEHALTARGTSFGLPIVA
jgi:hypothetical protein